jgi:hypothetical protein
MTANDSYLIGAEKGKNSNIEATEADGKHS